MLEPSDSDRRCEIATAGVVTLAMMTALGVACSTGPRSDNPFESQGATDSNDADASTGAPAPMTTTTSETSSDTSGGETEGLRLDVGSPATTGEQDYCNFVDILFVIDNSLSMNQYQTQLALAWPTFVDAMWDNLPEGTDLHVGMTTTAFYNGSCSELTFNCASNASQSTILSRYIPPTEGTTSGNGEQGRLFEWDGQRYFEAIVGEDSGELKTWFSQAAVAAGETGCSFEMPSAGAAWAVHPANAEHNAGFLRDEGAVLVIIVLTDEPDKSPEGADVYYQMVMDAKQGCGGDPCVVVSGLVDVCISEYDNALWQFFNLFEGFENMGSIDDPSAYAQVVGETLAQVIGQTCDEITPVG